MVSLFGVSVFRGCISGSFIGAVFFSITVGTDMVEARKLEHDYPHAIKVKYKGSKHESS